jgi:pentatricopeptide repeat protein
MTGVLKDSRRHDTKFIDRLAALIGIGSCSMLVMFAFIGVFRGYSVQSKMLTWLLPFVMVCILFYGWQRNFKSSIMWFCWAVVVVYMFIGGLQGVHYDRGYIYYDQGHYNEAAAEFEKETQLWYLKLGVNFSEPAAMGMLAQSYCQLGEYDKAVGVYELIISRYQDVRREVASFRLQRLKDGLRFIAQYNEGDIKLPNDYRKLYDMAYVYELDLKSYKKAVDIYKTITEMNIPVEDKNRAYEAIKRLTPAE